jgi:hypothetical protein
MSELTKEELKALKEVQKNLFKGKKTAPRDTMLYRGDPILNKYYKRGGGFDFSNMTEKDRKYLQEKRKKYQMKNKNLKKPVSTLRSSKDKKFQGHTGYR